MSTDAARDACDALQAQSAVCSVSLLVHWGLPGVAVVAESADLALIVRLPGID
jgi:hypothetical protein